MKWMCGFGKAVLLTPLLFVLLLDATVAEEKPLILSDAAKAAAEPTPLKRMEIRGRYIRLPEDAGGFARERPISGLPEHGGSGGQPTAAKVASDNNEKPKPPCDKKGGDGPSTNPMTSGPVILSTGEKYLEEGDFSAAGLYGMSMVRRYHSKGSTVTMFGQKWAGTYDYPRLVFTGCVRITEYGTRCFPQTIKFTDDEGASYTYTRSTGFLYTIRGSVSAGTFVYDPEGQKIYLTKGLKGYTYDLTGKIVYARLNASSYLGFSYGGPGGVLSSVTNSVGQYITFNWTGSRVTSITDTGGNIWTYSYTNYMLSSVTWSGSNPDTRTYHYEDSADNTLVTGISINSSRFSTYAYDSSKRVVQSAHTGGELSDTFDYSVPNQTKVTDALGQPTFYTFALVQGKLSISTVSRAATSTCTSASGMTVYDSNGWVDYTLDWKGNRTDFNYDASGRMLQATTAAGTPRQLTTTHQWLGEKIAETNYLGSSGAAYLKVQYTYFTSGPATGEVSNITQTDLATGSQRVTTYTPTINANGFITAWTETRSLPGTTASTVYAYDSLGRLTSVTNAIGHLVTFSSHTGLGSPGRMTDANGVITDYAYNPNGTLAWESAYVNGRAIA